MKAMQAILDLGIGWCWRWQRVVRKRGYVLLVWAR